MFLNVKLQRLCKSHHLQCITSSKDSEKLEKSLCVRDKAEDLPETTVGKRSLPCHLQMPTKALSCKRKPYVNMVQKCCRVLWAKAHLKWTVSKWKSVLWSDESKFGIFVGNHGHRVLRAKEEGDLPAYHQRSVQKPASLMVWRCISAYGMGSLHVLEGTMNAERCI